MSRSSDEDVDRRLAELSSRPLAERVEFLLELGWSRPGRSAPGLSPFLADPEPMVRIAAAQARWQTGPDPGELETLVGILADGLDSDDDEVALMAGMALGNMGEVAVPVLVRRFGEGERGNPLIVRVLGEIAGDEALRFLERAAQSSDTEVAEEAQEALEAIAEEDSE